MATIKFLKLCVTSAPLVCSVCKSPYSKPSYPIYKQLNAGINYHFSFFLVKEIKKKRFSKISIVSGIMSVNSLAFLGTMSQEKQPHEPNLDRVESFHGSDDKDAEDDSNTLQRAGDYVRRNRPGSAVSKKWSRTNTNRRYEHT